MLSWLAVNETPDSWIDAPPPRSIKVELAPVTICTWLALVPLRTMLSWPA